MRPLASLFSLLLLCWREHRSRLSEALGEASKFSLHPAVHSFLSECGPSRWPLCTPRWTCPCRSAPHRTQEGVLPSPALPPPPLMASSPSPNPQAPNSLVWASWSQSPWPFPAPCPARELDAQGQEVPWLLGVLPENKSLPPLCGKEPL